MCILCCSRELYHTSQFIFVYIYVHILSIQKNIVTIAISVPIFLLQLA